MMDTWTKRKRSEVMRLVRSRGNLTTELRLISFFRAHRITGWRRNQKLPGKPDFVFHEQRVCVFVDGCFWHGCPACYRRPASNRAYWDAKAQRNRTRDRRVNRELRKAGWRVLRIWEHELAAENEARLLRRLRRVFPEKAEPDDLTIMAPAAENASP
jgi:DNA mismatch endonuclease (patch repair protein)